MGPRISVLVLTAIPFSTAIGLIFLFGSQIPISNMVLFSFVLVLGMVVDGAIIVAENIHRHLERGVRQPVQGTRLQSVQRHDLRHRTQHPPGRPQPTLELAAYARVHGRSPVHRVLEPVQRALALDHDRQREGSVAGV